SVRRALGPSAPPIAHIRHEMGRHMTSGAKAGRMAAPGDRSHVDPAWPREWTVTAEDVLAGSEQDYPQAVRSWAASTVDDLDRALGWAARSWTVCGGIGRLGPNTRKPPGL